jgi:hypothetical protein
MSAHLDLFRSLAVDLDDASMALLRRDVRGHYEELERRRVLRQVAANDLAEELATRLAKLLEAAPDVSPEHRAAIVGAARYFVSAHDDVPDELDGGLDDDVEVFNHVAELVGRPDIAIARARS